MSNQVALPFRVVNVITKFLSAKKQFTILDITEEVRNDGGDIVKHEEVKQLARPILDGILVRETGNLSVCGIVVEIDGNPVQVLLYYPVNSNPEDYKDKVRSSAAAKLNAIKSDSVLNKICGILSDVLYATPEQILLSKCLKNFSISSEEINVIENAIANECGVNLIFDVDSFPTAESIANKVKEILANSVKASVSQKLSQVQGVVPQQIPTPVPANVSQSPVPSCTTNARWWCTKKLRADGAVEIPQKAFEEANLIGCDVDVTVHPNSISLVNGVERQTKDFRIASKNLKRANLGASGTVTICVFSDKIVICK